MRLEHVLFFDNDNLKENEKEAKAFFKYLYYDLYELFYTKVLYYDENHEGKVKNVLGFSSPITSAPNPEYNSKMDIVWIELETRHSNKAWMNIEDLSIVDLLKVISKKYPKLKITYCAVLTGKDLEFEEVSTIKEITLKNGYKI